MSHSFSPGPPETSTERSAPGTARPRCSVAGRRRGAGQPPRRASPATGSRTAAGGTGGPCGLRALAAQGPDPAGPRVEHATWDREVATVNGFFTWAVRQGCMEASPIVQRVTRARSRSPRRTVPETVPAESSHTGPRRYAVRFFRWLGHGHLLMISHISTVNTAIMTVGTRVMTPDVPAATARNLPQKLVCKRTMPLRSSSARRLWSPRSWPASSPRAARPGPEETLLINRHRALPLRGPPGAGASVCYQRRL